MIEYENVFIMVSRSFFLQGDLVYNVIGDSIGPFYFGVNDTTGVVTLKNDLRTDTNNFQYVVCSLCGLYYDIFKA